MSVRQEKPPTTRTRRSWDEAKDFADKALANRDEWFAVDIPESIPVSAVHGLIRNAVIARIPMEIKTNNGIAYLRIGETA